MSDDDDFMADSDAEEYDFEYEDDDEQEDAGDVDVENKYYNAKQMREDNPQEAIDEFLGLPALEEEKGDWGFKGLKQAIKLEFKQGLYDKAVEHYKELLTYIKSAVTRNYSEKSINNMLDFIEKGSEDPKAYQCMEQFYALTLDSLMRSNNERLWLKTNLKLARLWLEKGRYTELTRKLRELHKACQGEDGVDDPSKGTYSLETYALEIQMYSETKNNKQLKPLYQRALKVKSAVPHPKIMGIIRECGGKMHLNEESWEAAKTDFNDAFRSYDEAGSMQRITILKYLCLATMLMGSNISPFDSQETQPYKGDKRIAAMTDLVDAYQHNEIHRYESTLSKNPDLLKDNFIAENIDEVTRSMRMKAILKLVAPYRRFTLDFIADELKIPVKEVQDIVAFLIADDKIDARVDGSGGTITRSETVDAERTAALEHWVKALRSLSTSVLSDGDGFRSDDPMGSGFSAFGNPYEQTGPMMQPGEGNWMGGGPQAIRSSRRLG